MRRFADDAQTFTAVVSGPLFLDVIFASLDRMPEPGQELWCDECGLTAGGAANQARALARLGFQVELCSYVGEDAAGTFVRSIVDDDGVGSRLLQPVKKQAVTAAISVQSDRAMVSSGSNEAPPLSGPAPDLLMADLRAIGEGREVVRQWRQQGTCVIGDVGWDGSGAWDVADLEPLDLVDAFVPNEDEARAYTRTNSAAEAARALADRVERVVVTRGSAGVAMASGNMGGSALPAFPAQAIDATGAGDVFSAALGWALLRGGDLRQAVSVASVAGALSTETLGGDGAPTVAELRARVNRAAPEHLPGGYDLALLSR
ncbi:MAG: carbohydrate kinase family protein [Ancrocorticia sp.]|uniref:carbohydrate kinase family protein n=1 Tax=Ancrocorticia sp. TaxID=2593684 RepID=UPI003F8FA23D